MKKRSWILTLGVLLLGILACAGPASDGSGPRVVGTVDREAEPVSKMDAVEAIQTYALDVLGLNIPDLKAGGRAGDLNLPITTQDGYEVAVDLAGTSYVGFWKQGFASLSVGDSSVSGDWFADVQDGSLGAFVVRLDQNYPADAFTALDMLLTTFPGLRSYEFSEIPKADFDTQGFEFQAGSADDVRLQSWEITLTGTTITSGVRPGVQDGKSIAWVVVASGALATPFNK